MLSLPSLPRIPQPTTLQVRLFLRDTHGHPCVYYTRLSYQQQLTIMADLYSNS